MSDTLPPLPETPWVALIHTAAPYEPEWTSRQAGYDKETMEAYASAAVAAERERCAKVAWEFLTKGRSPLGQAVAAVIRAET